MSLDGRVEWIEKQNFLYYRVLTGWDIDAMLADAETLLSTGLKEVSGDVDNYNDQTIIVLDKNGVLTKSDWRLICNQRWWNDNPMAVVTEKTSKKYLKLLNTIKINFIRIGKRDFDYTKLLKILRSEYNFHKIRVDSDGKVNGILLKKGLVDMISIVFSPKLTGGKTLNRMLIKEGLLNEKNQINLRLYDLKKLEGDFVWFLYEIIK